MGCNVFCLLVIASLGADAAPRGVVHRIRGGSLDMDARASAELFGIEQREKEVVKAITGASKKFASALGVRGGSLDMDARASAEMLGIQEPEKAVVEAIAGASKKFASALGVRGGSFYGYAGAREYADICGIEEPEKSVVTTIKTAISSVVTAPLRVFRR